MAGTETAVESPQSTRTRDDFSLDTIEMLKKRAAFICSRPECRNMTIAPSEADENKAIYIGVASHICAASESGPRYDAGMTPDERKDISNGIFLCGSCSMMVDKNNGIDFPKETLHEWKSAHEEWVRSNLNKSVVTETPVAVSVALEFQQQVGGIGNNAFQINAPVGTVNINPSPTVSSRAEAFSQPRVANQNLNDKQAFICSEAKKLSQVRGEIFDPSLDYDEAIMRISSGDKDNAATLIIRIYGRLQSYFQKAEFSKDEKPERAIFEAEFGKMQSLHDGTNTEDSIETVLLDIEKSARNLFSILK